MWELFFSQEAEEGCDKTGRSKNFRQNWFQVKSIALKIRRCPGPGEVMDGDAELPLLVERHGVRHERGPDALGPPPPLPWEAAAAGLEPGSRGSGEQCRQGWGNSQKPSRGLGDWEQILGAYLFFTTPRPSKTWGAQGMRRS